MKTKTGPRPKDATIELTSVPAYGSFLHLKGVVGNADAAQVRIAVYIRVHGGWWTKPYWDAPATPLAADGTFSVDITTGGQDEQATEIAAYLIPAEYNPPGVRGEHELPEELLKESLAHVEVTRAP